MFAVPAAGVPAKVAVPSPLSVKVTPLGSAPLSLRAATGKPLLTMIIDSCAPVMTVALLALVMAGAWSTVRVKFCWALGSVPLLALIVIE